MCHQHGGDAELALHAADGTSQLLADLRVQCAERFIQQQYLRLVRQGARHGHPLLLTAGKLRRKTIVHAFERHQFQQLLPAGAPFRRAHAPHPQRELDVLGHGEVAEQRIVLEHEADAALARTHARDVLAMQRDGAVVYIGEAGDGAQQRALAAAAGTQQNEELAFGDLQGNVVDDGKSLISLGNLFERNGHARRLQPREAAMLATGR